MNDRLHDQDSQQGCKKLSRNPQTMWSRLVNFNLESMTVSEDSIGKASSTGTRNKNLCQKWVAKKEDSDNQNRYATLKSLHDGVCSQLPPHGYEEIELQPQERVNPTSKTTNAESLDKTKKGSVFRLHDKYGEQKDINMSTATKGSVSCEEIVVNTIDPESVGELQSQEDTICTDVSTRKSALVDIPILEQLGSWKTKPSCFRFHFPRNEANTVCHYLPNKKNSLDGGGAVPPNSELNNGQDGTFVESYLSDLTSANKENESLTFFPQKSQSVTCSPTQGNGLYQSVSGQSLPQTTNKYGSGDLNFETIGSTLYRTQNECKENDSTDDKFSIQSNNSSLTKGSSMATPSFSESAFSEKKKENESKEWNTSVEKSRCDIATLVSPKSCSETCTNNSKLFCTESGKCLQVISRISNSEEQKLCHGGEASHGNISFHSSDTSLAGGSSCVGLLTIASFSENKKETQIKEWKLPIEKGRCEIATPVSPRSLSETYTKDSGLGYSATEECLQHTSRISESEEQISCHEDGSSYGIISLQPSTTSLTGDSFSERSLSEVKKANESQDWKTFNEEDQCDIVTNISLKQQDQSYTDENGIVQTLSKQKTSLNSGTKDLELKTSYSAPSGDQNVPHEDSSYGIVSLQSNDIYLANDSSRDALLDSRTVSERSFREDKTEDEHERGRCNCNTVKAGSLKVHGDTCQVENGISQSLTDQKTVHVSGPGDLDSEEICSAPSWEQNSCHEDDSSHGILSIQSSEISLSTDGSSCAELLENGSSSETSLTENGDEDGNDVWSTNNGHLIKQSTEDNIFEKNKSSFENEKKRHLSLSEFDLKGHSLVRNQTVENSSCDEMQGQNKSKFTFGNLDTAVSFCEFNQLKLFEKTQNISEHTLAPQKVETQKSQKENNNIGRNTNQVYRKETHVTDITYIFYQVEERYQFPLDSDGNDENESAKLQNVAPESVNFNAKLPYVNSEKEITKEYSVSQLSRLSSYSLHDIDGLSPRLDPGPTVSQGFLIDNLQKSSQGNSCVDNVGVLLDTTVQTRSNVKEMHCKNVDSHAPRINHSNDFRENSLIKTMHSDTSLHSDGAPKSDSSIRSDSISQYESSLHSDSSNSIHSIPVGSEESVYEIEDADPHQETFVAIGDTDNDSQDNPFCDSEDLNYDCIPVPDCNTKTTDCSLYSHNFAGVSETTESSDGARLSHSRESHLNESINKSSEGMGWQEGTPPAEEIVYPGKVKQIHDKISSTEVNVLVLSSNGSKGSLLSKIFPWFSTRKNPSSEAKNNKDVDSQIKISSKETRSDDTGMCMNESTTETQDGVTDMPKSKLMLDLKRQVEISTTLKPFKRRSLLTKSRTVVKHKGRHPRSNELAKDNDAQKKIVEKQLGLILTDELRSLEDSKSNSKDMKSLDLDEHVKCLDLDEHNNLKPDHPKSPRSSQPMSLMTKFEHTPDEQEDSIVIKGFEQVISQSSTYPAVVDETSLIEQGDLQTEKGLQSPYCSQSESPTKDFETISKEHDISPKVNNTKQLEYTIPMCSQVDHKASLEESPVSYGSEADDATLTDLSLSMTFVKKTELTSDKLEHFATVDDPRILESSIAVVNEPSLAKHEKLLFTDVLKRTNLPLLTSSAEEFSKLPEEQDKSSAVNDLETLKRSHSSNITNKDKKISYDLKPPKHSLSISSIEEYEKVTVGEDNSSAGNDLNIVEHSQLISSQVETNFSLTKLKVTESEGFLMTDSSQQFNYSQSISSNEEGENDPSAVNDVQIVEFPLPMSSQRENEKSLPEFEVRENEDLVITCSSQPPSNALSTCSQVEKEKSLNELPVTDKLQISDSLLSMSSETKLENLPEEQERVPASNVSELLGCPISIRTRLKDANLSNENRNKLLADGLHTPDYPLPMTSRTKTETVSLEQDTSSEMKFEEKRNLCATNVLKPPDNLENDVNTRMTSKTKEKNKKDDHASKQQMGLNVTDCIQTLMTDSLTEYVSTKSKNSVIQTSVSTVDVNEQGEECDGEKQNTVFAKANNFLQSHNNKTGSNTEKENNTDATALTCIETGTDTKRCKGEEEEIEDSTSGIFQQLGARKEERDFRERIPPTESGTKIYGLGTTESTGNTAKESKQVRPTSKSNTSDNLSYNFEKTEKKCDSSFISSVQSDESDHDIVRALLHEKRTRGNAAGKSFQKLNLNDKFCSETSTKIDPIGIPQILTKQPSLAYTRLKRSNPDLTTYEKRTTTALHLPGAVKKKPEKATTLQGWRKTNLETAVKGTKLLNEYDYFSGTIGALLSKSFSQANTIHAQEQEVMFSPDTSHHSRSTFTKTRGRKYAFKSIEDVKVLVPKKHEGNRNQPTLQYHDISQNSEQRQVNVIDIDIEKVIGTPNVVELNSNKTHYEVLTETKQWEMTKLETEFGEIRLQLNEQTPKSSNTLMKLAIGLKQQEGQGDVRSGESTTIETSDNDDELNISDDDSSSVDLSESSLECLLEMLLQRGKVQDAVVMDLEGKQLAKSSSMSYASDNDLLALVAAVNSSYSSMVKLSVFEKKYVCFGSGGQGEKWLIGRNDREVIVVRKGGNYVVAGLSDCDSSGSCLKELEELVVVLNQRELL